MYLSRITAEEIDKLEFAFFQGEIVVVDCPGPLMSSALRYLRRQKVIGFDTETRPCFTPHQPANHVALLQLSGPGKAFLFRVNMVEMPDALCRLLANPRILKVGAAVHDDIRALQKRRHFQAAGFVDLQKIAQDWGIADKSVKKMAAIILGIRISKTQQLSNWEAPVLSDAQQNYAATDAWVCLEMYKKLLKSEKAQISVEDDQDNIEER